MLVKVNQKNVGLELTVDEALSLSEKLIQLTRHATKFMTDGTSVGVVRVDGGSMAYASSLALVVLSPSDAVEQAKNGR